MTKVVVLKWNSGRRFTSIPLEGEHVEKAVQDGKQLYKPDTLEVVDFVEPHNGGCWFCRTDTDEMYFDSEFDTFVHKQCLEDTLRQDPNHPEARLMAYLLEVKIEEE